MFLERLVHGLAMRIVFFNPIGEIGGAERVLLTLIAGLSERGAPAHDTKLEPILLLGSDGPLRTEAERLGAATEVLPLPASLLSLGDSRLRGAGGTRLLRVVGTLLRLALAMPAAFVYLIRMRRLLNRLAPDVVHSNGIKSHLVAALALPRRTPLVWHVHDFLGDRALVGRLMRRLSSRAALAVANSEAVRVDAASLLAPLEVRTIYNGIDTTLFSPFTGVGSGSGAGAGANEIAPLDRLGGLSVPTKAATPIRIGLVATYARWKGHETFLEAAAQVVGKRPGLPVLFYLIGGPIYRTAGSQYSPDELRSLVEKLGLGDRVGFVPFQTDAAAAYRALDVVVHASTRREPFGLTIVEAMSCGRAVIVSSAGGAAEIVESGVNGLAFEPGNVAELAAAMISLCESSIERERLGQGGRRTAVERFGAEKFARAFAELYAELVRRGSR